MKFIIIILISFSTLAGATEKNKTTTRSHYKKARNQFILEYTVFGVDECIKENSHRLVTKGNRKVFTDIEVGSTAYFSMLSNCFTKIKNLCPGNKCIVSKSMDVRLESIKHVDKILNKYKNTKSVKSATYLKSRKVASSNISKRKKE